MSQQIDLGPAATRLAHVAERITDDQLDTPTPNDEWTVGELLAHVVDLVDAFRAAAEKDVGGATDTDPGAVGPPGLAPDWRVTLAERLPRLVEAWRTPEAWTGMTRAGGLDLPGEVAGIVVLDELVLHGWDLAVATGQHYAADDAETEALIEFVSDFDDAGTPGMFGPARVPDDDATPFDRLLARAGRDPRWRPPVG